MTKKKMCVYVSVFFFFHNVELKVLRIHLMITKMQLLLGVVIISFSRPSGCSVSY